MDYLLDDLIDYTLEKVAASNNLGTFEEEEARYNEERRKIRKRRTKSALVALGGAGVMIGATGRHKGKIQKINAKYQDVIDNSPYDIETSKGRQDFYTHVQGDRPEAFMKARNRHSAVTAVGTIGGAGALYGGLLAADLNRYKLRGVTARYAKAKSIRRKELRRIRREEAQNNSAE